MAGVSEAKGTSGDERIERMRALIRDVPDFPSDGILFRDVTPLLGDARALADAADLLAEPWREEGIERVLGIESRGFILGPLVATRLGAGFVPVRKAGKLPWRVLRESYALEYGEDTVEMHEDAVGDDERVLIVDDLVATGGTAAAACTLAEQAGARIVGLSFLVELAALEGRARLGERRIESLLTY